ncbi:hypothetical protein CK203_008515 [Vitis vinifera]|uniref:Uncharacterized protein n=1 Tax=Vitis vinifera TaxID=29760 RepID=A0A438KDZ0_VITVI|nr:hypothetical protein CK203_008515 [Vitis vinifera]
MTKLRGRGSEIQPSVKEIDIEDSTVDELQHMLHQMQMGDETLGVSASMMIAPPSLDRANLFSLCFPNETTDYGVVIELADMIDGLFRVFVIKIAEEDQSVPAFVISTIDMYEGIIGPIEGVSNSVDPPLSFEILSKFVTYSDYILDIYDEIAQHDSDEKATPIVGYVEIVDFSTANQPRELKIGSPLSTNEKDNLIHLLRSYLDVFAWSYEDMPGLDPFIVQHHLPIFPHDEPVKQRLR